MIFQSKLEIRQCAKTEFSDKSLLIRGGLRLVAGISRNLRMAAWFESLSVKLVREVFETYRAHLCGGRTGCVESSSELNAFIDKFLKEKVKIAISLLVFDDGNLLDLSRIHSLGVLNGLALRTCLRYESSVPRDVESRLSGSHPGSGQRI